jgi:protein CpxP
MQIIEPVPRKRRVLVGALITVVVLAAGSALALAHGMGGGMHHGGMGAEEMTEHLQTHVRHVLEEVDATPEQKTQINDIVAAATKDLEALHEKHGGIHKQLHEIFTAPTIDRVKLEAVRAEHVQALDEASKRCAAALADAAEVLTPEQRKTLGEKMAKRHAGF